MYPMGGVMSAENSCQNLVTQLHYLRGVPHGWELSSGCFRGRYGASQGRRSAQVSSATAKSGGRCLLHMWPTRCGQNFLKNLRYPAWYGDGFGCRGAQALQHSMQDSASFSRNSAHIESTTCEGGNGHPTWGRCSWPSLLRRNDRRLTLESKGGPACQGGFIHGLEARRLFFPISRIRIPISRSRRY